jgi:hypothetical protein
MATALINGINYSWSDIKFILFGVPVRGIVKIEYKAKQSKENNYGFGVNPVSRGYGNKEYEASIELYKDEWNAVINAAPNRDPLDIAPFDIQVIAGSSRVTAFTDVLQQCEFMEDPFTVGQGDSKIMVTLPLIIAGVEHKI